MFKNIEISEINQTAVSRSLWLVCLVFLITLYSYSFVLFPESRIANAMVMLSAYYLIGFAVGGIIIYGLEYLVLTKSASHHRVYYLIILESIVPVFILFFTADQRALDLFRMLAFSILLGQALRLLYLSISGKMYNSVNINYSK